MHTTITLSPICCMSKSAFFPQTCLTNLIICKFAVISEDFEPHTNTSDDEETIEKEENESELNEVRYCSDVFCHKYVSVLYKMFTFKDKIECKKTPFVALYYFQLQKMVAKFRMP